MISPVSFKGTYNIDLAQNKGKDNSIWDIETILMRTKKDYMCYTNYPKSLSDSFKITFVTDDSIDNFIEKYMVLKEINFQKFTKAELLNIDNIKSRIVMPEYRQKREFQIVNINTKKFNEAYKKYGCAYVGDKDNIAFPERYTSVKKYLKTGQKIEASEVYVTDKNCFPEICFQDGRHRYAYFRDMGMKTIPVVMNQESIAAAKKYGLLAD